jgi:hypothetical protein
MRAANADMARMAVFALLFVLLVVAASDNDGQAGLLCMLMLEAKSSLAGLLKQAVKYTLYNQA